MSIINFPDSPNLNDIYTHNSQSWTWNGTFWAANGTSVLQGETGLTGAVGPTGPTGATGATGLQGEVGPTGLEGATGPTGATGPQGVDGIPGQTGDAGVNGDPGETGPTGPAGTAATVDVGSTYTYEGVEGSFVFNAGDPTNAVLDFYLAPGPTGPTGPSGADGGFESTQIVESISTSRSVLSSDAGKLLTNSAAITLTVGGLSIGQQVDFIQTNASQITFAAGAGVTLNSKESLLKTAGQYAVASIKCIALDVYVLAGDLS